MPSSHSYPSYPNKQKPGWRQHGIELNIHYRCCFLLLLLLFIDYNFSFSFLTIIIIIIITTIWLVSLCNEKRCNNCVYNWYENMDTCNWLKVVHFVYTKNIYISDTIVYGYKWPIKKGNTSMKVMRWYKRACCCCCCCCCRRRRC